MRISFFASSYDAPLGFKGKLKLFQALTCFLASSVSGCGLGSKRMCCLLDRHPHYSMKESSFWLILQIGLRWAVQGALCRFHLEPQRSSWQVQPGDLSPKLSGWRIYPPWGLLKVYVRCCHSCCLRASIFSSKVSFAVSKYRCSHLSTSWCNSRILDWITSFAVTFLRSNWPRRVASDKMNSST